MEKLSTVFLGELVTNTTLCSAVVLCVIWSVWVYISVVLASRPVCSYGIYRGADKSLTRTTSLCILFDASLVIYTYKYY